MGEPISEQWIAASVQGKSFAEVGGLWGTVNERVTVAARCGAAETAMIDVIPRTMISGRCSASALPRSG
jgi:hypothetical protein